MQGFPKRRLAVALATTLLVAAAAGAPARAQSEPEPSALQSAPQPADETAKLDRLLADLAQPNRPDWEKIESEINRIWSESGSPSMDLLLERGNEALQQEDYPTALEHFSALIDHAPDFAEGWNGRATTYFLMGEYSLSIADVEHVLVLNPRHFGALAGLGFMMESLGETDLALRALRKVQELNPNRPNINEAVIRLEKMTGDAEL